MSQGFYANSVQVSHSKTALKSLLLNVSLFTESSGRLSCNIQFTVAQNQYINTYFFFS